MISVHKPLHRIDLKRVMWCVHQVGYEKNLMESNGDAYAPTILAIKNLKDEVTVRDILTKRVIL